MARQLAAQLVAASRDARSVLSVGLIRADVIEGEREEMPVRPSPQKTDVGIGIEISSDFVITDMNPGGPAGKSAFKLTRTRAHMHTRQKDQTRTSMYSISRRFLHRAHAPTHPCAVLYSVHISPARTHARAHTRTDALIQIPHPSRALVLQPNAATLTSATLSSPSMASP